MFELNTSNTSSAGNCLLQFNKETGKITIVKNDTNRELQEEQEPQDKNEKKSQMTINSFISINTINK
jgi:hypothetical protein